MYFETILNRKMKAETYSENGVLYWITNDAPVPLDCFEEVGCTPPENQAEAIEKHINDILESYRENYKGPSEEEMYEMRAAFGEGTEVVNMITGTKIHL